MYHSAFVTHLMLARLVPYVILARSNPSLTAVVELYPYILAFWKIMRYERTVSCTGDLHDDLREIDMCIRSGIRVDRVKAQKCCDDEMWLGVPWELTH